MTSKQWKLIVSAVIAMIVAGIGVYTGHIDVNSALSVISENLVEIGEVVSE